MNQYDILRANADKQRAAANSTPLANRRAMHLRSAEAWDAMALAIRDTAERAIVNQAAKTGTTAVVAA